MRNIESLFRDNYTAFRLIWPRAENVFTTNISSVFMINPCTIFLTSFVFLSPMFCKTSHHLNLARARLAKVLGSLGSSIICRQRVLLIFDCHGTGGKGHLLLHTSLKPNEKEALLLHKVVLKAQFNFRL